ncbi:acetylxylan esterase [Sphingosinicella sp. BN140058]|uniref:alpha/beta hydrolase n=1 Tax=Sphingosinicella sp. BN140058 TaxID=1892855 RepID=UPI0013EC92EF|nr:acetylxylan esterase [Sphingosinicella sp. BN140058]
MADRSGALIRAVLCRLLPLLPVLVLAATPAPAETPRDRLIAYLTELADQQTSARAATISAIATKDAARLRQAHVRATLADLTGFERARGPLRSQVTRISEGDGYRTESLWYESLPGYRVSAIVYRPVKGEGPFPAIILQPGHGSDGKLGNHGFAADFARAGFIALSIDIVGEGERIQHYDPELGASKVGRPTGEHSMAFGQALPNGGHIARFFIQDAVRGVDYLLSRADVDGGQIGAFGCSGGGTITAYLAAFDPRIAATAVDCYANDFDHLLARGGPGPQDAEQSIPFFLDRGLDLPDWIEAAAPRPYAIVSTSDDMFPIAGARAAFAEARRFYGLLGAGDAITMIEGPGGHGNLAPIAPAILEFFTRWLKTGPPPAPRPAPIGDPARLLVSPTGNVAALGSATLQQVIAAQAPSPPPATGESGAQRLARLRAAVRDVARLTVAPGNPPPEVCEGPTEVDEGFTCVPISFDAAPGMRVDGVFARASGPGRKPTLLLLSNAPPRTLSDLFGRWARAGWNVLALEPRGAGGSEEAKSPWTGDWTLLSLRALLVGKTPLGLRADDALAALNWLAGRPEVGRIALYGIDALAPVALHVALLDDRVGSVTADGGILRYREFATRPISRDMAEINLPGVLARYDLPDLAAALGDRLTLVNPINSVGETGPAVTPLLPPDVRVRFRAPRDPIPSPSE